MKTKTERVDDQHLAFRRRFHRHVERLLQPVAARGRNYVFGQIVTYGQVAQRNGLRKKRAVRRLCRNANHFMLMVMS